MGCIINDILTNAPGIKSPAMSYFKFNFKFSKLGLRGQTKTEVGTS